MTDAVTTVAFPDRRLPRLGPHAQLGARSTATPPRPAASASCSCRFLRPSSARPAARGTGRTAARGDHHRRDRDARAARPGRLRRSVRRGRVRPGPRRAAGRRTGPRGAAAAVRGESAAPEVTQSFDCVVVGGGMAGCCVRACGVAGGRSRRAGPGPPRPRRQREPGDPRRHPRRDAAPDRRGDRHDRPLEPRRRHGRARRRAPGDAPPSRISNS